MAMPKPAYWTKERFEELQRLEEFKRDQAKTPKGTKLEDPKRDQANNRKEN